MKPEILIDTPAALARVCADRVAADAQAAIAARGRFSLALPGGSVAETFLPVLARRPLAWDKVEFFWSDERAVGPDHPDSNYGLAKRLLLDPVQIRSERVHRIVAEGGDIDAAAHAYEAELVRLLGDPPRIDLVVLGVGPDGHVCSLFPGHPLLQENTRYVAAITDSPKPPPQRVTFTLQLLQLARALYIAGFGDSKAEAIRATVEDPEAQIPAALAVRAAQRSLILVDRAAAHSLQHRSG